MARERERATGRLAERLADWRASLWAIRDRAGRRAERAERETYALYLGFRDDRTPWYAKAVLLAVLAYALSPLDPIPDVLPVVGYLDELLLLPAGVWLAARLVPEDVLADCRERADDADPGRLRWVAAGVVLLLWLVVAWLVVSWLGLPEMGLHVAWYI